MTLCIPACPPSQALESDVDWFYSVLSPGGGGGGGGSLRSTLQGHPASAPRAPRVRRATEGQVEEGIMFDGSSHHTTTHGQVGHHGQHPLHNHLGLLPDNGNGDGDGEDAMGGLIWPSAVAVDSEGGRCTRAMTRTTSTPGSLAGWAAEEEASRGGMELMLDELDDEFRLLPAGGGPRFNNSQGTEASSNRLKAERAARRASSSSSQQLFLRGAGAGGGVGGISKRRSSSSGHGGGTAVVMKPQLQLTVSRPPSFSFSPLTTHKATPALSGQQPMGRPSSFLGDGSSSRGYQIHEVPDNTAVGHVGEVTVKDEGHRSYVVAPGSIVKVGSGQPHQVQYQEQHSRAHQQRWEQEQADPENYLPSSPGRESSAGGSGGRGTVSSGEDVLLFLGGEGGPATAIKGIIGGSGPAAVSRGLSPHTWPPAALADAPAYSLAASSGAGKPGRFGAPEPSGQEEYSERWEEDEDAGDEASSLPLDADVATLQGLTQHSDVGRPSSPALMLSGEDLRHFMASSSSSAALREGPPRSVASTAHRSSLNALSASSMAKLMGLVNGAGKGGEDSLQLMSAGSGVSSGASGLTSASGNVPPPASSAKPSLDLNASGVMMTNPMYTGWHGGQQDVQRDVMVTNPMYEGADLLPGRSAVSGGGGGRGE